MSKESTRRTPITSRLAHEYIKSSKSEMYVKIAAGLEKLKVGGIAEEIAVAAGLKSEQVSKRLAEMVDMGLVFNVGITRPSSSGRSCMVRQLTSLKHKPGTPIQANLF